MNQGWKIQRQGPVKPVEIEDLREAVGWDRCEGTYEKVLQQHYAYYTARDPDGRLIGYLSVLSDGIADAFLLDLMVHPLWRRRGIGRQLVQRAAEDVEAAGIRCLQVTFSPGLEGFYAACGFHLIKGGIIDFKTMPWTPESREGTQGKTRKKAS